MKLGIHFLAIAATLFTSTAQAQVTVKDAWVRGTVAQQRVTGAFMQLTALSKTTLIGASSPAASIVEIHEMATHDNVMRMRQVTGIELPAGKTVELKPGAYHLMLMGLKQQLKEGDKVAVTLAFQDANGKRVNVEVAAAVRALNAAAKPSHE